MTRRDTIGLLCLSLLTGFILCIAMVRSPNTIVKNPEETSLSVIHLQNFSGDEESLAWRPSTPHQQQAAREIVQYLASCQETCSMRRGIPVGYPADWPCITLILTLPDGSTRGVILGPADVPPGSTGVNLSYAASADANFFSSFQGTLLRPAEIRAFVLDALELPVPQDTAIPDRAAS